VRRPDGAFQAVPEVRGKTKLFRLVGRQAPWTLRSGLTLMANTYNGVVPGPVIDVREGDRVVIDYRNELDIADTLHLHGIHGGPPSADGVGGWEQDPVPPHGRYRYEFTATQPGTFIYHSHDRKATVDAGLYGAVIVHPAHPRPEERADRDYVIFISSWPVQSTAETENTINGKEYPDTAQLEVRRGERVRLRYVSMSSEEFHTMHIHGHEQIVIARDAWPLEHPQREDSIALLPSQRVDVIVPANAAPGTWMLQCHVLAHIEDAAGMPSGLITALHYAGSPQKFGAMYASMRDMAVPPANPQGPGKLSFLTTVLLGAFAGLTIFLGLPVARAQRLSATTIGLLNALAIGILAYLVVEIAQGALRPITAGMLAWKGGSAPPLASAFVFVLGLMLGLGGLGVASSRVAKRGAKVADNPLALAMMIAIGIGAHNFAEGLAIGASAAAGATVVAFGLIVGFALHNATEGFGIAAPLAGRGTPPSWKQLGLAGLIAGGPTFLGSVVGYELSSPLLSTLFLATAVGALIYVIGELWAVLKKTGVGFRSASMVAAGFVIALATELIVDLNG
jgi:ZIP family zinc transporter